MRNSRTLVFASCILAFLLVGEIAQAQPGPISGTEPIDVTIFQGSPFEEFYQNVFDLNHEKHLIFEGAIFNESPEPQQVDFWFDWIDPNFGPQTGVVIMINLDPGEGKFLGTGTSATDPPLEMTLPFCPEQVSVHFSVADGSTSGGPIVIDGTFTHTCLIPEPGTIALAGVASLGFVGVGRRRH